QTIPEPYFDIANHCLRRDPQLRWTVGEIATRLQRAPVPPVEKPTPAEPERPSIKKGYVIAAVAAVVLLFAIFSGRRFNHHPGTQQEPSGESTQTLPESKSATEAAAPLQSGGENKEQANPNQPPAPPVAPKAGAGRKAAGKSASGRAQGAVDQQVLPDV